MARKFGKKKEISVNPLDYNIGIAGLSGLGKSTLMKNVCEKLVGDQGYLMLDIGKESGHDCISGIVSETIEDWEKLDEVLDEIVENRTTEDWVDLKIICFDTLDELFSLAENYCVKKYSRENPGKKYTSVNEIAGGFGRGLDMVIDLVLNRLWSLKEVGISFSVILHTKTKEIEDPVSGATFQTITATLPQRYFNAVKTKLDILGVVYLDRDIIKEKIDGRKDIKGKDMTRNVIASEARKISFRSDNYNVDCKSRFSDIVPEINLDADEFIKALTDAIKAEQSKSGKSFEETKAEQEKAAAAQMEEVAKKEVAAKEQKKVDEVVKDIITYMQANKSNKEVITAIMALCKDNGVSNPTTITDMDLAQKVLALCK